MAGDAGPRGAESERATEQAAEQAAGVEVVVEHRVARVVAAPAETAAHLFEVAQAGERGLLLGAQRAEAVFDVAAACPQVGEALDERVVPGAAGACGVGA